MGFFRQTSNSRTTATIPASTTLSARTRSIYRTSILTAGALTCAGALYMATNPTSAETSSTHADTTRSVQLHVKQQAAASDAGSNVPSLPADNPKAPPPTHTSVQATVSGGQSPTVTINGQNIDVPENGSINKTITNANGQTSLDIHASSDGTASNNTSTSLNISVNSSSTSYDDNSP